jgi:iron complex outermembrane receptor protein
VDKDARPDQDFSAAVMKEWGGIDVQRIRGFEQSRGVPLSACRYTLLSSAAVAVSALIGPQVVRAQTATPLPEIDVIGTSPLSSSRSTAPKRARPVTSVSSKPAPAQPTAPTPAAEADPSVIDRDKVPSNTQVLRSADFDHGQSPTILDSLAKGLPGVSLSDQSGNAFQRNLDYRGFTASPVPGTPQGLAVYQNGVRINESYGDIVNWDFIPEMAINRASLVPNNPVFGLNAIGGALSLEMKNGFTYQGREAEAIVGSYGRFQAATQIGIQDHDRSFYISADSTNDHGWRDFSSSSQLRRIYADAGTRTDQAELHVAFTGADNYLGSVAATPVELLNQKWSSVYTWPQTTHLQLAFLTSSFSYALSDTLSFQSNAYYRGFWQSHVDGNGTDAQPCDPLGPIPGQLCIGDGATPINQNFPVPNTLSPNAFLAEIDRNSTATNSFGGSAQATSSAKWLDHDNHIVAGVSLDHGRTQFKATSELGTIDQNLFVTGTGVFIDQPDDDITPVSLLATNTYTGIYATDTFDLTSKLSITGGARFNVAEINLADQTGANPLLTSSNTFQRLNPIVGATYKFTPNLTGYASYSEANRAPTPLELGCSDPVHPCMIDNFLIADPPLKQVVSHTYEAGLRGTFGAGERFGQLSWGLGVFRTETTDDIINIASAVVPMFGYFQNAAKTLRQGVEAKVAYKWDRWNAYANYTFVDATYQTSLTLSSADNPAADINGNIFVSPGDHIPGIPAHRFKAGIEYVVADAWKIGADLNVTGSQYLIHDDANQNPKVPAYAVVNLHGSYQLTKSVELFGLVNNLFNQHYYAAGTFFSTSGFNSNTFGGSNFLVLNDPRTFLPGMPLAVYAGARAKF